MLTLLSTAFSTSFAETLETWHLDGVDVPAIATVTTGYAGDYYYEWTVPEDVGMFKLLSNRFSRTTTE